MSHNLRPVHPISAAKLTPELHGGLLINRTPEPISWEAYSRAPFPFRVVYEGKVMAMIFEPQHTTDADEAIGLFRLLFATLTPQPRPLAWETVPENIRRHFTVLPHQT